jgi:uncharacterized protein (TIGR03435 family)
VRRGDPPLPTILGGSLGSICQEKSAARTGIFAFLQAQMQRSAVCSNEGIKIMRNTVLTCVFFSGCCGAYGQTAPEFEVASVKQLAESVRPGSPDLAFVGTSGKPFRIEGHRVSVKGTLHALIADAYGVKEYQLVAAPGWADALKYEIVATTSGDTVPTQDQVRPMLQALLADRFQMKVHADTKEMPVYYLRQVKKSNLLKAAGPDETFSWKLSLTPDRLLRSKATRESIGDFVQLVGVSADRPVVDKTGITGDIDYDILISPPGGGGGGDDVGRPKTSPEDVNRAIIYAVIDQLGLKLEPAKDSIAVLVVDKVDKPSAN